MGVRAPVPRSHSALAALPPTQQSNSACSLAAAISAIDAVIAPDVLTRQVRRSEERLRRRRLPLPPSPSPPTLCRRRCHHLPRPTRALYASSVASASILTPSIAVDASCRCHVLYMGRHLGPPGQFGMVLGISGTWTSTRTRSSGHTC